MTKELLDQFLVKMTEKGHRFIFYIDTEVINFHLAHRPLVKKTNVYVCENCDSWFVSLASKEDLTVLDKKATCSEFIIKDIIS